MKFKKYDYGKNWIICDSDLNFRCPEHTATFAFDTENVKLLDGKQVSDADIFKSLDGLTQEEKRNRLESVTWSWQCYDEFNGFFSTNNFYYFLNYCCLCKYKFGWCYNSTFDFSQIDYKILGENEKGWKLHEMKTGERYDRGQPWTYRSLHNSEGARYSYKLWCEYKNENRHKMTHAIQFNDFMKLCGGGLAKVLKDLNVTDNDGNEIRKLEMDYQNVNIENPNVSDIEYNATDVIGLYFAVKKFNDVVESRSGGECSIFGNKTNIMTAGGLAKRMLLRSLYPDVQPKFRIKKFQKQHPISVKQDKWLRQNHLYRGGISLVNENLQGRLLTEKEFGTPMYRYDVNSEYPYAMSIIRDLVGEPKRIEYSDWLKFDNKEDYESILMITGISGTLKKGMVGTWYDPFQREYVNEIEETGLHLIFEFEFNEMKNWYDFDYIEIENVIVWKRGDFVYRPFVEENYKFKRQAKIDKNGCLESVSKLLLNSSYGKLSERVEKETSHYELNNETGAVHLVIDSVEISEKSMMNVAVGALVTATARTYILSKAREICGSELSKKWAYIDTDSLHIFAEYNNADAYSLGGLKEEARCVAVKYLAPKCYIDIESDGTKTIHTKGVSTKIVKKDFEKFENIDEIDTRFDYGRDYIVLIAMNLKGGKALIPTRKTLAKFDLMPENLKINRNNFEHYLNEL